MSIAILQSTWDYIRASKGDHKAKAIILKVIQQQVIILHATETYFTDYMYQIVNT